MSKNISKNIIEISNSTIIRIILFGVLLLVLYQIIDLILAILTAIVIASFIEPVIERMKKYKIRRTLATVIIYILLLVILAGLFYVFVPTLVDEMSNLVPVVAKYFPSSNILQSLQGKTLSGAKDIVSDLTRNVSLGEFISSTQNFLSDISNSFLQSLGSIFGGIFNVILIFVISFYLSIQEKGIEKFLRIVVPFKHEEYAIDLWRRVQLKIGKWFQGQLLDALIVGILTFLGLTLFRVEYALFLSVITTFLTIIPFGVILAAVFAIIFGFIGGGIKLALIVAGLYFLIQQFENYLLQPVIVRRATGISPLVVILSVLIGTQLAGFLGLILAIPVAVFILEFVDDLEKEKSVKK